MVEDEKMFAEHTVRDVSDKISKEVTLIKAGSSVSEAVEKMLNDPATRYVFVVDEDKKILGVLTLPLVLRYIAPRAGVWGKNIIETIKRLLIMFKETVDEIMITKVPSVKLDESLNSALKKMCDSNLEELPIVDDEGRVIGELSGLEVMVAGLSLLRKTEKKSD